MMALMQIPANGLRCRGLCDSDATFSHAAIRLLMASFDGECGVAQLGAGLAEEGASGNAPADSVARMYCYD